MQRPREGQLAFYAGLAHQGKALSGNVALNQPNMSESEEVSFIRKGGK